MQSKLHASSARAVPAKYVIRCGGRLWHRTLSRSHSRPDSHRRWASTIRFWGRERCVTFPACIERRQGRNSCGTGCVCALQACVCVHVRERERERERESLYHKVLGASCVLKRRYIHLSICTARPIYFTARPRASEGVVLHLLVEGTSQPRLVRVCGYVGVSVVQ